MSSTTRTTRPRTQTELRNSQPQPAARPANLSDRIESIFPSRFLKAWHLLNNSMQEITDTIKSLQMEPVTTDGEDYKDALVIYFCRIKTPYLLSAKADMETLKKSYGVRKIGDLVGLEITLVVTEFRRDEVLRVKPLPYGAKPKWVAPIESERPPTGNTVASNNDADSEGDRPNDETDTGQ